MQPKTSYITDRVLHWCSASAIIFLLLDMGTRIHNIDYRIKGATQHKQDAIELHIGIALLLLIVLLARIVWYQFYLHRDYKVKFENTQHNYLIRFVHYSLYSALLAIPTQTRRFPFG